MFKNIIGQIKHLLAARPFASLFSLLGIFLLFIIIGNTLNRPPDTKTMDEAEIKQVTIYRIGEAPTLTVQAQVEKSGVVTITALTGGVIQKINFHPGDTVKQGHTLLSMASNYQGDNALYLQSQIAARQLQNMNETYDTQKDILAKQREIAGKTDEDADELRKITDKSINDTKDIINLNNSILDTLNANTTTLEAGNSGGVNDAAILSAKQLKSQFLSANNQLNQALRNAEYRVNSENPPTELSDLQREITLKQLDIQEKAVDLNRDVTRLQLQVAKVQSAMMYPASPFNATVQRVFVKVGQAVNAGSPLVILSQTVEEDPIVAMALVPREIALQTTYAVPSVLSLGENTYETYPSYISRDAVEGTLYGIYFPIPDSFHQDVTDEGYINVTIPIGYVDTNATIPYVPIDSVYQTQEHAYIFVAENGSAVVREITLGPVTGRYVEVTGGLKAGDRIILDRTVVSGDRVLFN